MRHSRPAHRQLEPPKWLISPGSSRKASTNLAHEGGVDYLLVVSMEVAVPLPAREARLGRRTVLTFPLLPPPQKN